MSRVYKKAGIPYTTRTFWAASDPTIIPHMQKIGVYILLCHNQRYYIGSTNDIDRRLAEHEKGRVLATKNILPVTLAFFQSYNTLLEARKVERSLKKLKSKKIIEQIISDGYIKRAAGAVG